MNHIIFLLAVLTSITSLYSCSQDEQKSLFKDFEENWEICYEDLFHFPNDGSLGNSDYIKCELGNEDVLINKFSLNYDSYIYYSFSGIAYDTFVNLPGNQLQSQSLLISFIKPEYLTGFYIKFKFPKDSLNYTIQKLFANNSLNCSSNFNDREVEYYVGTHCQPNGRLSFSTFYSTVPDQQLFIDEFTFNKQNGYWHYRLKYSADQLILTNERWNSKTKTDIYGRPLKSNILIEDIPVKDLTGLIEFRIEEGK